MPVTPNMDLDQPVPEATPGPEWAQKLNDIDDLIDRHDHTPGRGVPVTQAGISINDSFTLNGERLIDIYGLQMVEAAVPAGSDLIRGIYVYQGDLWYKNPAGALVQITSGASLAVSGSGAISYKEIAAPDYPYSIVAGDAQKVLGILTGSARTLNLPSASTGGGMFFKIKDISGLALLNPITLVPDGSDTVEGFGTSYELRGEEASWELISDGVSKWYIT